MDIDRRHLLAATLAGLAASPLRATAATAWPSMPLTLTVPFAAGGGTDMLARALAVLLGDALKGSVIVDNRAGAAGNIGAEMVARDTTRHRLLFTTASIAVNQSLYTDLRYSLAKDLQPVSMLTSSPLVLAVPGSGEARSLDDLKRMAAKRSGGLNFGSPGNGTTSHLGGVVLAQALGMPAQHVPYKGAGPVTAALIGKEVDFSMIAAVAAAPHLRSGALRALGIAGRQAPPGMESVPLLTKAHPQVEFDNWQCLFASHYQPAEDVARLYREIAAILRQPDVVAKIHGDGALPLGLDPAKTTAMLNAEVARYRKIVQDFRITVG